MTTGMAESASATKTPAHARSRFQCILLCVVLVLILLVISLVVYYTSQNFRVEIDFGCGQDHKLQGLKHDGGFVFKGIPYAKPPVGELRWKPTVPLTINDCNSGSKQYNAYNFKSPCIQKDLLSGKISGSEDCLYINVWTPTINKNENIPVMVYIHGGNFLTGSGNTPGFYPNTKFAIDTNMVHVTFNYRLSAMGFMALESLSQQNFGFSGNYGLFDQIAALEWIHNKIHHFGGNPGHVTVYGHGSGGTSLLALLTSQRVKDLIHRAIMSSGSSVYDKYMQDAFRENMKFVENAGCHGKENLDKEYSCLMNMSAVDVVNAVPYHEYPSWTGDGSHFDLPTNGKISGAIPVVDGVLIRAPPLQIWESFDFIDVPLVIGNVAQEIDLNPTPNDIDNWSWDDYATYVRAKLETFGQDISNRALELYPTNDKSSTPRLSFTTMATDICCTCPYDNLARRADEAFTSRVYRYVATSRPSRPVLSNSQYAFHGWDMFAFFGTMGRILSPNTNDRLFRDQMQLYLTTFARTAEMPNIDWLDWQGYFGNTAIISNNIQFRSHFNATRCNFWMNNGFFKYAWIN